MSVEQWIALAFLVLAIAGLFWIADDIRWID